MSDKYYFWRLSLGKKGFLGTWNEVTEDKFNEMQRNSFFGPSTVSGAVFQGRILSAPKIDVELIGCD